MDTDTKCQACGQPISRDWCVKRENWEVAVWVTPDPGVYGFEAVCPFFEAVCPFCYVWACHSTRRPSFMGGAHYTWFLPRPPVATEEV